MKRSSSSVWRVLPGLSLLFIASPLPGQAVVSGMVRDEETGQPLAGTEVLIEALGRKTLTDSGGRFVLGDIAFGMRKALIRRIGYHPIEMTLHLIGPDTLRVNLALEPSVVRLAPVEGRAAPTPGLSPEFDDRRRLGGGHFIGPDEIREYDRLQLKDVLRRVIGVRIIADPRAPHLKQVAISARSLRSDGDNCYMTVYLDGMLLYPARGGGSRLVEPPDLGRFPVASIEAIEVYRGVAETPVEFAEFPTCGTIVLWSRRR